MHYSTLSSLRIAVVVVDAVLAVLAVAMANMSTLRPTLVSLLKQYSRLVRRSPPFLRVLAASLLCSILGGLYVVRRRRRKAEQSRGRTLLRRNSAMKLKDGAFANGVADAS